MIHSGARLLVTPIKAGPTTFFSIAWHATHFAAKVFLPLPARAVSIAPKINGVIIGPIPRSLSVSKGSVFSEVALPVALVFEVSEEQRVVKNNTLIKTIPVRICLMFVFFIVFGFIIVFF